MAGKNLIELSEANFDAEVLQSDQPVLVDFWAEWCGPCLRIAPIVEELAGDYAGKVKVGKLNIDHNQSLAGRYGVMSIPTLMVFKGGEPVERMVGLQQKSALVNKIEGLI